MKRVAASEFDLLTVARALVGDLSPDAVEPLLRLPRKLPPKLGSTAVRLLEQILGRGLVLELCRRGGWRDEGYLRDGDVVRGRLWQRVDTPPSLHLTGLSVQVCRWLTAAPLSVVQECKPLKARQTPLPADQLVLYLACDLAQRCGCAEPLARAAAFRRAPLCWVGFPELLSLGGAPTDAEADPAAFAALVQDPLGRVVLEALQQDLARRWFCAEQHKAHVIDAGQMIALGASQQRVVEGLMRGAEEQGRRDLLGFVPAAGVRLLRHRPAARRWVQSLSGQGSLQQREAACRGAGAFLQALQQLHRWAEQARGVRFFDDDYEAGQLLLRQWEPLGPSGVDHARQLLSQLSSLDASLLAGPEAERPTGSLEQRS